MVPVPAVNVPLLVKFPFRVWVNVEAIKPHEGLITRFPLVVIAPPAVLA